MDVVIAGSLLSLVICVGALALEWRHLHPGSRGLIASKPDEH